MLHTRYDHTDNTLPGLPVSFIPYQQRKTGERWKRFAFSPGTCTSPQVVFHPPFCRQAVRGLLPGPEAGTILTYVNHEQKGS